MPFPIHVQPLSHKLAPLTFKHTNLVKYLSLNTVIKSFKHISFGKHMYKTIYLICMKNNFNITH